MEYVRRVDMGCVYIYIYIHIREEYVRMHQELKGPACTLVKRTVVDSQSTTENGTSRCCDSLKVYVLGWYRILSRCCEGVSQSLQLDDNSFQVSIYITLLSWRPLLLGTKDYSVQKTGIWHGLCQHKRCLQGLH